MYRIVYQNWTKEMALLELINGGYNFNTEYDNIPEYIKKVNIDKIKKKVIR